MQRSDRKVWAVWFMVITALAGTCSLKCSHSQTLSQSVKHNGKTAEPLKAQDRDRYTNTTDDAEQLSDMLCLCFHLCLTLLKLLLWRFLKNPELPASEGWQLKIEGNSGSVRHNYQNSHINYKNSYISKAARNCKILKILWDMVYGIW